MGIGDFVGGLLADVAFAGDGVEEDEVFFKGLGLGGDFAAGGEGDAGAVEDERVVAADLVDIDDRALVVQSDGTEHAEAEEAFVYGERGGGEIDEDAGALGDEFGDRIAGVHGGGPEGFIVPDVFADGDAELFLGEAVDVLFFAGLEIAGFVEDVVGGEKHFGLFEDDAAFVDEGGFIGNGLPCPLKVDD